MTRLWKAWEVARELRVPVGRVEAWIREGKVATVRTGPNTTLIPQAEVEQLIARATVPARSTSSLCLNKKSDREDGQPG